jgi:hypothetical protein
MLSPRGRPIQCARRTGGCDNPVVGERDAAQADQLIRALCDVRDDTIRRLSWLEDSQLESAALRREINEAQAHINRLQHRYLGASAPRRV